MQVRAIQKKLDAGRNGIQEDYSLTFKQKISKLDTKLKGVTALLDFTVDVLRLFDRTINDSIIAKPDLEFKQINIQLQKLDSKHIR